MPSRWYAFAANEWLGSLFPLSRSAADHRLRRSALAEEDGRGEHAGPDRERAQRRRRRAPDPRPQRAARRPRRDVAGWAALRPLRPAPEVRAPLGAGLRRPVGRVDRDRGARGRPRDPARKGVHPVPGALGPVAGRRVRLERLVLPPPDRHVRSGAGTDPARDPALRGRRALPARDLARRVRRLASGTRPGERPRVSSDRASRREPARCSPPPR